MCVYVGVSMCVHVRTDYLSFSFFLCIYASNMTNGGGGGVSTFDFALLCQFFFF